MMEASSKLSSLYAGDLVENLPSEIVFRELRHNLARAYGCLPHQTDDMPIDDVWYFMISNSARKEAKEYDSSMSDAWRL